MEDVCCRKIHIGVHTKKLISSRVSARFNETNETLQVDEKRFYTPVQQSHQTVSPSAGTKSHT